MKITEKMKLAHMLNKHTSISYIASHMYSTEAYEYFLIVESGIPTYIIKYNKIAKYFSDIIPLCMCGVNPIFANNIAEASLEWSDIQDENKSNTI